VGLALATGCGAREHTPAPGGALLYQRYCASCHGAEGRGDGPAAAALEPAPIDLTRLGCGAADVMERIDGRRAVRAHGSSAMPVWGEVFEQSLLGDPHTRRTALLHVQAIADHVVALRAAR
jgi:mono/diheme cytochrome c family protein